MKYGIVHYGSVAYHRPTAFYPTCEIVTELPQGRTISLWKDSLSRIGFDIAAEEPTPKDLFQFVKAAFEEQKNELLEVEFVKKYIASPDGKLPIPSNCASRLYSGKGMVYVDELILSALFEYIAVYYLWARDF